MVVATKRNHHASQTWWLCNSILEFLHPLSQQHICPRLLAQPALHPLAHNTRDAHKDVLGLIFGLWRGCRWRLLHMLWTKAPQGKVGSDTTDVLSNAYDFTPMQLRQP